MRIFICFILATQWIFSVSLYEQMRAYFFYKSQSYQQALPLYERIYNEQEHCANAYNLANVYYKMEVYASAVRFYQESLELPCKENLYPLIWHNLGNALFKLNRYQEAYNAYQSAITLKENPQSIENLHIMQTLLEQRKSLAKIITKPKAQDSQKFQIQPPLLAPQISEGLPTQGESLKPW